MKRDYSFEVFIIVIIATVIAAAVIYGLDRNNTNDTFYGKDRVTSIYNNYDDVNMLEPNNDSSRPVKGICNDDSIIQHNADSITHRLDSINKRIINDYNKAHKHNNNSINNNDYDIVIKAYNFDELSYMMRKGYTIHQLSNIIRTNLSNINNNHNNHNNSSYSRGYNEGYDEGYNKAKKELENN